MPHLYQNKEVTMEELDKVNDNGIIEKTKKLKIKMHTGQEILKQEQMKMLYPLDKQPFTKFTGRDTDFRSLNHRKKLTELGPGPARYRPKNPALKSIKGWRDYSKDTGREKGVFKKTAEQPEPQKNGDESEGINTRFGVRYRGILGESSKKKSPNRISIARSASKSKSKQSKTNISEFRRTGKSTLNQTNSSKYSKNLKQALDQTVTKMMSKSKDSFRRQGSFDSYEDNFAKSHHENFRNPQKANAYNFLNISVDDPSYLFYSKEHPEGNISKETTHIPESKITSKQISKNSSLEILPNQESHRRDIEEEVRNRPYQKKKRSKYKKWLRKNKIKFYESSSSLISADSKERLKKLTVKERKARFKAHFKKMRQKNIELQKLVKKKEHDSKNIPGFKIEHFRGHVEKRFRSPFFQTRYDINCRNLLKRSQLNPNYDAIKSRRDKGVPIFNFNRNFNEKLRQLSKSQTQLDEEKKIKQEKRRKFQEKNRLKWLKRKKKRDDNTKYNGLKTANQAHNRSYDDIYKHSKPNRSILLARNKILCRSKDDLRSMINKKSSKFGENLISQYRQKSKNSKTEEIEVRVISPKEHFSLKTTEPNVINHHELINIKF